MGSPYAFLAARQHPGAHSAVHQSIKSAQLGEASITTEVTMPAAALRRAASSSFDNGSIRVHLGRDEASDLVAVDGWKVVGGLAGCL